MQHFDLVTFSCPDCDYPYEPGVQTDPPCPSCGSCEIPIEGPSRVSIHIPDREDVLAMQTEELDESGNVVEVQAGSRFELRLNQETGDVYTEPVPTFQPQMRDLTADEVASHAASANRTLAAIEGLVVDDQRAALKQQRDEELDRLEAVAVKEG